MAVEEYIGVTAITGEEGSCKSSMSLTWPTPTFHFEIDFGGFERAEWFLKKNYPDLRVKKFQTGEELKSTDFTQYDILTKPYPKPLQVNKLMGQLGSIRQLQQPKKVEGMKELWQEFITDFVYVCSQKHIVTSIFDSSTALWNICHGARLQEIQEVQVYRWMKDKPNTPFSEDEYRERLQPLEYGQPNDRMTTLLQTSRAFRKNLVLTHYPTDEYGMISDGKGGLQEGRTGKQVIDGFKHTAKNCDLIVWTSIKETVSNGKKIPNPVAKITKCGIAGMGLNAVGMEIPATFQGFINLRNLMRGS